MFDIWRAEISFTPASTSFVTASSLSGSFFEIMAVPLESLWSSIETNLSRFATRRTGASVILAEAGMTDAPVRRVANLDKFVSMEDHKDSSGTAMISKNDPLSEEAVTKLVEAGVKEISARQMSNMDAFVVMESYNDKSGAVAANKGDALTEELLTK